MDYSKQGINSETSSDENGRNSPEKLTDNSGTVRTYECAFCNRGFTNAQALGGHMNIHRKDKAKAKQKKNETTPNPSIDEDNMSSSRYFTPITNDQTHHHAALRAQMNYQFYFPVPNPSYPPPHAYYQSELTHRITSSENLGANLSLEIGSSSLEDGQGKNRNLREDGMEYELDLELRLGHGPC